MHSVFTKILETIFTHVNKKKMSSIVRRMSFYRIKFDILYQMIKVIK